MFKKYNSIENSYRDKYITKALSQYPELKDETYCLVEKLDGANLQLFFQPNKEMQVGKRSCFISKDEDFYSVWDVLSYYSKMISKFQEIADTGHVIRVYGELYGEGIQKRVKYGHGKHFSFFDVEIDGKMLSQLELNALSEDSRLEKIQAPVLCVVEDLETALNFNVNFDSRVAGIENNPSEGVIIRPYNKEYTLGNGSRFILKKKADSFSEKMKAKPGKKKVEQSAKLIKAKLEFESYINDNRVSSIFSKHGIIENEKDIGKYIQMVIADAKDDFLKDYDISDLSDKELKKIYSGGGKYIVSLLRKHL